MSIEHKLSTTLGTLYQGDCVEWMQSLPKGSVDLLFADPPFNLKKDYTAGWIWPLTCSARAARCGSTICPNGTSSSEPI